MICSKHSIKDKMGLDSTSIAILDIFKRLQNFFTLTRIYFAYDCFLIS